MKLISFSVVLILLISACNSEPQEKNDVAKVVPKIKLHPQLLNFIDSCLSCRWDSATETNFDFNKHSVPHEFSQARKGDTLIITFKKAEGYGKHIGDIEIKQDSILLSYWLDNSVTPLLLNTYWEYYYFIKDTTKIKYKIRIKEDWR